jgi:hypothetical protein
MTDNKSGFRSKVSLRGWAAIAAVLAAAILVFDFTTKGIGVIEKTISFLTPEPTPHVSVKALPAPGNSQCLQFAFTKLPRDFSLGEIKLLIKDSKGPSSFSGDQSSEIFQRRVNAKITLADFINKKTIIFRAAVQSEKSDDDAYVDFCPILDRKAQSGTLEVVPLFFEPDGKQIKNITTDLDGGKKSISFIVSYPNNIDATLTNDLNIIAK